MKKTVLLTGGCGFIGSHVAEAYLAEGYRVIIVDNLSSGNYENICHLKENKRLFFLNIDIRNKQQVLDVFNRFRPNIVNHHAAQKSVPYSVENPLYDLEENLEGLINLIVACGKFPIEKFIYISSGGALSKEILGNDKSKEDDKPQLESPYAITKFAGENYIKLFAKLYGFDYTILRYANVYGPRQIRDGECGVIPIFIDNIMREQNSILMTYPDMPKGCTRDYIYVDDVVDANMKATICKANDVFNIGSGEEIAILDIYNCIKMAFQKDLDIVIKGPRLGDVKRSVLDNRKAKKMLKWCPKTTLIEGINKIKEYMKDNK